MSDWTDYNERRTSPKPSYMREMPKRPVESQQKPSAIEVEEIEIPDDTTKTGMHRILSVLGFK